MVVNRTTRAAAMSVLVFLAFFWWQMLSRIWNYYGLGDNNIDVLLKYFTDFTKPVLMTILAAATMFPFFWLALAPGTTPSGRDSDLPT